MGFFAGIALATRIPTKITTKLLRSLTKNWRESLSWRNFFSLLWAEKKLFRILFSCISFLNHITTCRPTPRVSSKFFPFFWGFSVKCKNHKKRFSREYDSEHVLFSQTIVFLLFFVKLEKLSKKLLLYLLRVFDK